MTTLPQTTTIRLPRPAGTMQLAPSGGVPGPMTVGAPGASAGMTGGDLWRVLRNHVWLILAILVLSAAAGVGAFFLLQKYYPLYTATGYIQVQPNTRDIMTQNRNVDPSEPGILSIEQKTQAALLKSESLLTKVLKNEASEVRRTPWFLKFKDNIAAAKEDFADNYAVTPLAETRLVKVEFTYSDPRTCQTVVKEMCTQHIADESERVFLEGQRQSQQLNTLKNQYMAEKTSNDMQLANKRAHVSAGGGGVGTRVSAKELQLEELRHRQVQSDMEYKDASTVLENIKNSLSQGIDPSMVVNIVDQNQLLINYKFQKDNAEAKLDFARDKFGSGHPLYKQAEKEFERAQQKVKDYEAEVTAKARAQILENATLQASAAKNRIDGLNADLDQRVTELGEIATEMISFLELESKQKGVTDLLKQVDTQLSFLRAEQEQRISGKVQWSQYPEIPSNKSFPKLWKVLTLSIALGVVLAISIAFIREMTDTTVRSSRDIEKVGQMTVLGMVGDETQDPQAAGARLPLLIFDAPHSMIAEQLRQLRTRLQHAASLDTTRSLLVTSPSPGDGKTTIACNLAAGLALNGRRILLVDGNFRRPEIHKVFALPNERGFSDVLNGSVTFDEVVQETQVPNLAVMTSGPKPINATEMFESQLLIDFIERALEEFDHVIFDSGPMMVVSESTAMAPRVDGVITVVRAQGNSRGLLQRMRDTLRAVKAEHLGVVLNGVRSQGGGYYARSIKTYYEYQNG